MHVCLCTLPGGVWGWITNLSQARGHLHSRWGSAQTSQVTNGNYNPLLIRKVSEPYIEEPEEVIVCLRSVTPASTNDFFPLLRLFLSRWHQTCVLSSSRRTTSNRTPKDNGSSTLGTERTTSSRSFTEPSWSDVHFFLLLLSTCPSPSHQLTTVRCSSRSCPPPCFFFHSLSGYTFINYGWDFKWLLCSWMIFLDLSFPSHSDFSSSISSFFSFSQEEAITELLNMEKVGLSNWGKMLFFFFYHHI